MLQKYGRASNDFFKLWPEKEFYFTSDRHGFVSYGVSHNVAYVYGDPVAAEEEMATTIRAFVAYCHEKSGCRFFIKCCPTFCQFTRHWIFTPLRRAKKLLLI
ncbi:MAG: phosphatidylglycerol lysyltransferase domain-containing protein [Caldilineaceae bacterium]